MAELACCDKSKEELFKLLNSAASGLTEQEFQSRIAQYGLNEIKEKRRTSPIKIFLNQFKTFIVGILLVAIIISSIIKEYTDATVILIILVINAVLGFIQEYKAERAIEALKKLTSSKAKAIRDGKEKEIDSKFLVPGDVIIVETGDKIPADSRILESFNLAAQEAALTGESTPVPKDAKTLAEIKPVAEQRNMLFSGTLAVNGRCRAIVCRTGMQTELGKIASLIQKEPEKLTPLQKSLGKLGHALGIAVIVIAIAVFLAGILFGYPKSFMLITAIALAVAAVPEGLPAVVTISLALGVQKMIKKNALVRKLPSVETLGSTTVICTDKTGTLTLNQMTVKKIFANNRLYEVTGSGYDKEGEFLLNGKKVKPANLELLLKIGSLCNDADITENEVVGDPTEAALIVSAAKAGIIKKELEKEHPRIDEIQFTSERKLMSTFHEIEGRTFVFTKGAPDILFNLCDRIIIDGKIQKLTEKQKSIILKQNEGLAKQALRVLGLACKESKKLDEHSLIFVGLQAMIDPPREEVKAAIQKCRNAGIKVVMITGDHKITAEAIAKQIGIAGRSIDGKDIDNIDLIKEVEDISIYARVDPLHKVKIVDALKSKGHIVAMTGDGINDAPALKKADIGVAVGSGTDVAKEASDMILTDDNFASIVSAVEEGRTIFDNIKTFLVYLLSGNSGELISILMAVLIGLPLPLLTLQILWINIITETILAVSLSKEPPELDVMFTRPRSHKGRILNKKDFWWMIAVTVLIALGTLFVFYLALKNLGWAYGEKLAPSSYSYASTMAFTTFVIFQIFNIFNCKSPNKSVFFRELVNNRWLLMAIAIALILQMIVIYVPSLNAIFGTVPLSAKDWLISTAVASSVLWFGELLKLFGWKRE